MNKPQAFLCVGPNVAARVLPAPSRRLQDDCCNCFDGPVLAVPKGEMAALRQQIAFEEPMGKVRATRSGTVRLIVVKSNVHSDYL